MAFLKSKHRPGKRWTGPVAWCDDMIVGYRRGYYALTDDGKSIRVPLIRLTSVDDAPDNPDDGSCHYEISGEHDPPQRQGRLVELEVGIVGKTEVQS